MNQLFDLQLEAMLTLCLRPRLGEFGSQELATMAWALGRRGGEELATMAILGEAGKSSQKSE